MVQEVPKVRFKIRLVATRRIDVLGSTDSRQELPIVEDMTKVQVRRRRCRRSPVMIYGVSSSTQAHQRIARGWRLTFETQGRVRPVCKCHIARLIDKCCVVIGSALPHEPCLFITRCPMVILCKSQEVCCGLH